MLVTFTEPERLQAYVERNDLALPVLLDADRTSYRAYGFGRGTVARVWGTHAARRYLQLLRRDGLAGLRRLRAPVEDTLQLGGDMVIAADGTLAWGYWGKGPDDRPTVDELVAAVDRSRLGD